MGVLFSDSDVEGGGCEVSMAGVATADFGDGAAGLLFREGGGGGGAAVFGAISAGFGCGDV